MWSFENFPSEAKFATIQFYFLSKPAQPSWRFLSATLSEEASTTVMRAYLPGIFISVLICVGD